MKPNQNQRKIITLIFIMLSINIFTIQSRAAREIFSSGFEQGAVNFLPRSGDEVLHVTDEEAHNDTYSLKTTNRFASWHGPVLEIGQLITQGEYEISVWVKLLKGKSGEFKLSSQVGRYGAASYINIAIVPVAEEDGWVQLKGVFEYPQYAADFVTVYVEHDDAQAEYYIDDFLIMELSTTTDNSSEVIPQNQNQLQNVNSNQESTNWLVLIVISFGVIGLIGIFITINTYIKYGGRQNDK